MAPRKIVGAARPGGRSTRVVAAVMKGTLEVLGRVGFAHLRVDDVAARSKVNKTTIYRRWPIKLDLVKAALLTVGGTPEDIDTGDVREDLIENFHAMMRRWATERGRGVLRILAAERADPDVDELARTLRERYRVPRRRLLERAIARGQMPADADIELLLDVLTSVVLAELRNRPAPVDAAWLGKVVDFALAGARATCRTGRPSAPRSLTPQRLSV